MPSDSRARAADPGLSPKLPDIQVFLRSTSHIEALRHYVQHFRSGIPEIPFSWTPLWGALTWLPTREPATCYTIFSGNPIPGLGAPSISYDTHELRFTTEIVLQVGTETADLLELAAQMKTLEASLRDWMKQHPDITLKSGNTLIWRFTISPQDHTP